MCIFYYLENLKDYIISIETKGNAIIKKLNSGLMEISEVLRTLTYSTEEQGYILEFPVVCVSSQYNILINIDMPEILTYYSVMKKSYGKCIIKTNTTSSIRLSYYLFVKHKLS